MEPRTVLLILAVINGACGEQSTEDISNNTWSSFPPSLTENISSISVSIVPDQISELVRTTISSDGATTSPSFVGTSTVVSHADVAATTAISNENLDSTESSTLVINTSNVTTGELNNSSAATSTNAGTFTETVLGNELLNAMMDTNDNDSDSSGDGNPSYTPVFTIGHPEVKDLENLTEASVTPTHLPIIDEELSTNENINGSMDIIKESSSEANETVIVKIQHGESPTSSTNAGSLSSGFVLSPSVRNTSDYSQVLEEPASIVFDISTPISDSDSEKPTGKEKTTNVLVEDSSSTIGYFTVEDKTSKFEADATTNAETILTKNISDPMASQQTAFLFQNLTNNESQSVETTTSDTSTSSVVKEETRNAKMVTFPSVTPHLLSEETTTTTTTTTVNLSDLIKNRDDLTTSEYANAVTVIFTVPQSVQMGELWDEERNKKFRNFVINAINIEEEKGWPHLSLEEDATYKESVTEWAREKREIELGLQPEDIIYIAPSPLSENRNIHVAFFIRNGSTIDPDDVVDREKIFYAVKSTQTGLEKEMGLTVTRVTQGIVVSRDKDTTSNTSSGETTIKESDTDKIVEISQVRVNTETATPPIVIDNFNDPIKHHEDLKDNEYTNAVTVIFTVPQPIQMDVFWDAERNRKFRNFVINAINIEQEKGWPHLALEEVAVYEKYDTEWVRKKREIKRGLQAEDLIYIGPSPMAENRNIYVAFFIRNGSTSDPDDVVYGTKIFYAVNSTRIGLEQEMALNITRITPGIILVHYMESIFVRYAIVFIALLAVAVFCICVIIFGLIYIKCKSTRGKWDRSEYGDKSKLKMDVRISREMGNLHSDRDIQHDEAQGAKNGHPYTNGSGKLDIRIVSDDDGWVKPLDDNASVTPKPRQRTEDTKL